MSRPSQSDRQKFEASREAMLKHTVATLAKIDKMQEELTTLRNITIVTALRNGVLAVELSRVIGLSAGRISQIRKMMEEQMNPEKTS